MAQLPQQQQQQQQQVVLVTDQPAAAAAAVMQQHRGEHGVSSRWQLGSSIKQQASMAMLAVQGVTTAGVIMHRGMTTFGKTSLAVGDSFHCGTCWRQANLRRILDGRPSLPIA
jgi:hypothetical protein